MITPGPKSSGLMRVIIESPFRATETRSRREAVLYARSAMAHSISMGEAPFASHLMYPSIMDDSIPIERDWGIAMGFRWGQMACATMVYCDLGISEGMWRGIYDAYKSRRKVGVRSIFGRPTAEFIDDIADKMTMWGEWKNK